MWRADDRAVEGFSEESRRLSMNNPPTALVGFGTGARQRPGRLSMNNPPTALVGFGTPPVVPCRLSMNDPPTALVDCTLILVRHRLFQRAARQRSSVDFRVSSESDYLFDHLIEADALKLIPLAREQLPQILSYVRAKPVGVCSRLCHRLDCQLERFC